MSIEKMMCLSTGHISQDTAESLGLGILNEDLDYTERDEETPPWFERLTVYSHSEYGWLICLAQIQEQADEGTPVDLCRVIDYAVAQGCDWLLIDRDADLIDDLPHFDW
jgi:hypothetical protein